MGACWHIDGLSYALALVRYNLGRGDHVKSLPEVPYILEYLHANQSYIFYPSFCTAPVLTNGSSPC